MSDFHFKLLTIVLIVTTMGISMIFPHVELVLALVGSTIGTTICFIFPALIFIKLCDKNTIEYLLSYLLLLFGTVILIFCTFSALHSISIARNSEVEEKIHEIMVRSTVAPLKSKITSKSPVHLHPTELKSRISNMNKLKQSIQLDMGKLKKQEEILQRLEKQQQEHSKILKEQREIINELKILDNSLLQGKSLLEKRQNSSHLSNESVNVKEDLQKVELSKVSHSKVNQSLMNNSYVINRSEQLNKLNPNPKDKLKNSSQSMNISNLVENNSVIKLTVKQTVSNNKTGAILSNDVASDKKGPNLKAKPDKSNLLESKKTKEEIRKQQKDEIL